MTILVGVENVKYKLEIFFRRSRRRNVNDSKELVERDEIIVVRVVNLEDVVAKSVAVNGRKGFFCYLFEFRF